MRTKIVAGNWKMHKTLSEGMELLSEVVNMVGDEVNDSATQVIMIPPFIHLNQAVALSKGHANVAIGAQNCYTENEGAFTGEVSAAMVASCGASYVLVGHSERRSYFSETNAFLAKKVQAAFENDLIPVYCCGETLEERKSERLYDVIEQQISEGLFHLSEDQIKKVVVAYEPVWAIGTGVTASDEQAQDMHAFIRRLLRQEYGVTTAEEIPILYGGSVKPENATNLFKQPDIDGGLVGGASLKSRSFVDIIKAAQ